MKDCTPKDNPAFKTPLGPDIDGSPLQKNNRGNYIAELDMLQYLSIGARPDINWLPTRSPVTIITPSCHIK